MTSPTKFYCLTQIILQVWSCDQLQHFYERSYQFYKNLTRKTTFYEGQSCFKFNNLRLTLDQNSKFYTCVAKGLEQKALEVNSYVCRSYGGNLAGGLFALLHILNRVNALPKLILTQLVHTWSLLKNQTTLLRNQLFPQELLGLLPRRNFKIYFGKYRASKVSASVYVCNNKNARTRNNPFKEQPRMISKERYWFPPYCKLISVFHYF